MSNSPLVSYTKLSPHVRGKRVCPISRITVHHAVGLLTAEQLGECFQTERQASSNYGVGKDGAVALYVDEGYAAMCSSNWDNDMRSVNIECADEATYPYMLPDVVYSRLIDLCVDICKRNGKTKLLWLGDKAMALAYVPKDNEMVLTIHKWFAATACPGAFLESKLPDLAQKVTERLKAEAWNFTGDSTPAKWAAEAVEWAVDCGLIAGDTNHDLMLHSPVTREQMCVMLKRLYDLCNK